MENGGLITEISEAIKNALEEIKWKPESAARHLLKRKLRNQLTAEQSLDDYHHVIRTVLQSNSAEVYNYTHGEDNYPTIISEIEGNIWLVMLTSDGIMETSFVVENPEQYLSSSKFEFIGFMEELTS